MILTSSTIVLIVTGIFALVMLTLFLVVFILSENNTVPVPEPTPVKPPPATFCNTSGLIQRVDAPPYERAIPYSNGAPYSTESPSFIAIDHTVPKLSRLRSLTQPPSPNHWLGSAMFGVSNLIMCYPYLMSIDDSEFTFSWPGNPQLQEICSSPPCTIGEEQLIYSSSLVSPITLTCVGETLSACDIVNVDALCATINWQYTSPPNLTTAFSVILTQGSPYITINNFNNALNWSFSNLATLTKEIFGYTVTLTDGTQYALFMSSAISLTKITETLYSSGKFWGIARIAHYHDDSELAVLVASWTAATIESEVSAAVTSNHTEWNVNVDYRFAFSGTGSPMVMAKLPHQHLTNYTSVAGPYNHPLLGPYELITTSDNMWHIAETLPITSFTYPPVSNYNTQLITVWQGDVESVLGYSTPTTPVDWMRWLGSIANLALLGDSLGQNIVDLVNVLRSELSKIPLYNGLVTNDIAFLYDQRWSGIVTGLGITNCSGTVDEGNAFYRTHLGHHGYLIYAYAVAFYFLDDDYRNDYQETALYFARSLLNSSTDDTSFPLWRHKHWYLGYSLMTGIEPSTTKIADTTGEMTLGYYGCYLLGSILQQQDLVTWSLATLATETSSIKTNFQFASSNSITVNDHFVQGTITSRDDRSYGYIYEQGNADFPQKNASMSIPMLKPVTLTSENSLDEQWLSTFRPFVAAGITGNIDPESLCYGLGVTATSSNVAEIVSQFVSNCTTELPYGSTWSSVLYWVLSTYS